MKRTMLTSTSSSEPSSHRDCRSAWQRRVSTSTTPTHSRKGLKRHSDIIKTGSRSSLQSVFGATQPSNTSTQLEGNSSRGQFFLCRGNQDTSRVAGAHRAELPREESARQVQTALTIFRAEGSRTCTDHKRLLVLLLDLLNSLI
jgi:hypothetical protein